MDALLICSGGLDSVSLAHRLAHENALAGIIAFDYGQRHIKELNSAKSCAERLGVPYDCINIRDIGRALTGSALTDDVDVPDGHYAEESMKSTIVPNRNAIMMTIAFGIAASRDHSHVAIAVHGGDHFIYPDCRPEFIDTFERMQAHALDGFADIAIHAPYLDITKADIVRDGAAVGTPFAETWSCYKGREIHCGRCGTCVERREAFVLAGVADPTPYADQEFWRGKV